MTPRRSVAGYRMRVPHLFDALKLREATLDHPDALLLVARVQAYYTSLYGAPDTGPIDPRELAPPAGRFFLGALNGEPVLMGGWRFALEPIGMAAERPAEIKRMYTVPEYRRRGLARRLLAHLETSARADGADAMVLETGLPQADAVELYRSSGYTEIPRFGHYQHAPDAIHLGRML